MLTFGLAALAVPQARALTNGLALTPPMGWNSWYTYSYGVNESLIKSTADQMATNGMKAVGYQYVNMDDGWAGYRDTNGVMVADTNRFPSGIKALADYVHSKGLKLGLYSTGGTNTCAGFTGSCGYETLDAQTYASWGIDYVKYELCNQQVYEILPHQQACVIRMGNALLHSGRPILFSMSSGRFEPWMTNYSNLPRGTGDLAHNWNSILYHIDYVAQFAAYAGPGAFNDPDVLDIGGAFTDAADKAIFSMWCVLAAPLMTPNTLPDYTNVFCNAEAIAVDQDPAGIQGICVATNGDVQVWRKPLGGANSTNLAVVLLNRGTNTGVISANWSDLGLPAGFAIVRDLWAHADIGNFTNSYAATLPPQSSQFLKINYGTTIPIPAAGIDYLSDLPWLSDISYMTPFQLDQSGALTPLQLHGVTYPKGIGTVGNTQLSYLLQGAASRFQCDVGLDTIAGQVLGAVEFQVLADGILLYDSGTMTPSSATQHIDLNVRGRNRLTLIVISSSVANNYGDWAGARIIVEAAPTILNETTVGTNIALSWDAAPGAIGYEIFRSTSTNGPYVMIGSATGLTFTDTTAADQVTYFYEIATLTASGLTTNSILVSGILAAHWSNTNTATAQNWDNDSNWINTQNFPNLATLVVLVGADIPGDQSISLNQPITIGVLSIGDADASGAYTLVGGGGTLTLDNGTNPAVVTELYTSKGDTLAAPIFFKNNLILSNLSTNLLTLSGPLSGAGAISLHGGGPLLLSGSNSFTAPLAVLQGRLITSNSAALGGATGGAVISAGAALDINGTSLGAQPITISGSGPDGFGVLVSTANGAQLNALRSVTLTGDAAIGGTGRWDLRGTRPTSPSATLSTTGHGYKLTKFGPNQISLAAVTVDPALGDIDVQAGILEFETATTSLGNATNVLTVEKGATLSFAQTTNVWTKQIVLNGDGVTPVINQTGGYNALTGAMTLNGNCVVAVNGGVLTFAESLTGSGGLIKSQTGPLYLSNTSTYNGATLVNGGTLLLTGNGSISSSTNISVAAGALFDVSGLTSGGLTLAGGQTLTGAGSVKGNLTVSSQAKLFPKDPLGSLSFSNSLVFSSSALCRLGLSKTTATNGQLLVAGALTFNGTLVITNIGPGTVQAGDSFQLFRAGSYAGHFATILPLVPGPGLIWDTSQLNNTGTLGVTFGALPYIASAAISGKNLKLSGGGGPVNGSYYVIVSTNSALPLAQWSRYATNQFDGLGHFTFTDSVSSNLPARFYSLVLP